jgi:malic enzyme
LCPNLGNINIPPAQQKSTPHKSKESNNSVLFPGMFTGNVALKRHAIRIAVEIILLKMIPNDFRSTSHFLHNKKLSGS